MVKIRSNASHCRNVMMMSGAGCPPPKKNNLNGNDLYVSGAMGKNLACNDEEQSGITPPMGKNLASVATVLTHRASRQNPTAARERPARSAGMSQSNKSCQAFIPFGPRLYVTAARRSANVATDMDEH